MWKKKSSLPPLFINPSFLDKLWYGDHPARWLLLPFSLAYRLIVALRRRYLQRFRQQQFPVPVIVVGNLTVGGVGKTPLVIALAKQLKARGMSVGIVSRGYGAEIKQFPHEVNLDDKAALVGDEPLLLAKKTGCPVVIAPKRTEAVQYLLDKYKSQIIISDDGLQHYAMGRSIEIVVIDGQRGLGNGLCLPAGPLREDARRLQQADFIVVNGEQERPEGEVSSYRMDLMPGELTHLITGKTLNPSKVEHPVAAVAGIGNPQRFFSTLAALDIGFKAYSFPDHHLFKPEELHLTEKTLVMTEKDAVKCQPFATDSMYFLPVEASVEDTFWNTLWLHEQLQGHI